MTRISTVFLFLFAVACSWAQTPQNAGAWGPRFANATPAQSDWFDWMNTIDLGTPPGPSHAALERPGGENISVARLRHKPPGKAVARFSRGLKLARSGAWQPGAQEFERAVTIDPDFSEAYGNLGVTHSALGLFDRAASEFRRAIRLDPATGLHHLNLAYVLIRLNRKKEAEPEAQTAVSLDPGNSSAHYLLGFLFAQRPETRGRAIQHLVYAAREVPEAHFVLAEVYQVEGAEAAASQELEQFRKGRADGLAGGNRAASAARLRPK